MIGPGWLPRPGRIWRKRTLAYTRRRRKRSVPVERRAVPVEPVHHEIVIFDHGPAEFPVAIARPREARGRAIAMLADLSRWLAARWAWFRPRTVPVVVAVIGMLLVLISADYLAHQHVSAASITIQLR